MKQVVLGLIIVATLGIIGFAVFSGGEDETPPTATNSSNQQQTAEAQQPSQNAEQEASTETFTAEQVATHDNENDCWTIISGSVYDITSYIPRHPGGDEILRACGTDGTSLFTQRTTEDGEQVGSGTPHSSSAASQLEAFKVGELAS